MLGGRAALIVVAVFMPGGSYVPSKAPPRDSEAADRFVCAMLHTASECSASSCLPIRCTQQAASEVARCGPPAHRRMAQLLGAYAFAAVFAPCFCVSLFVFFARRHLMVWAVFAPKLIFEAVFGLALGPVLVLTWLVWSHVMASVAWQPRQQFFIVESR